ncbi:hypothetical protein H257_02546 [Aphanomyces astaci]|uniref:Uncharacterized protein n=1 Tax=Aphanomyces astaci TaxID=112090 RepID=W4H492_APHAT|nr:hypothetical protein H257_02546 [Aphanomyces astaci]ETV86059.1 hypothetical protein H257_02546 [Aphanomyces astaci]|eukprot:XP_009824531.1 hypothetical protein H257_02546 [Aphanomyces astaci]
MHARMYKPSKATNVECSVSILDSNLHLWSSTNENLSWYPKSFPHTGVRGICCLVRLVVGFHVQNRYIHTYTGGVVHQIIVVLKGCFHTNVQDDSFRTSFERQGHMQYYVNTSNIHA